MTSPSTLQAAKLDDLIKRLSEIKQALAEAETAVASGLDRIHPTFQKSARNLAHYVALRHRDIRPLQKELAQLGLSSLGRAEAHVMATLDAVLAAVHGLAGEPQQASPSGLDFLEGIELLREHTETLLGNCPDNRPVRIMVTMPSEAASDYQLVRDLLARGMNCMRINCSYDDREAWSAMAEHLKHAMYELGKECRLLMDIAGPKLRVGPMVPGPEVIKVRPLRNAAGIVLEPARISLVPEASMRGLTQQSKHVFIPVASGDLGLLTAGDQLELTDARGSHRRMIVTESTREMAIAECGRTSYLASGMELRCKGRSEGVLCIGRLPAIEQPIVLKKGETIILSDKVSLGRGPELADDGTVLLPATINCTIPEILKDIKAGERVWFDDGKIGGVIKSVNDSKAYIEITHASIDGSKLRQNKGINLPDSNLSIDSLTPKDLEDLQVIAKHADIVGMSFVRTPADVEALEAHLVRLGRVDIGLLLKTETRKAFDNLPLLVLAAMHRGAAGVMIARGDLAVECGFERMAEIQEEILWLCEAAHMPVVWATQVLENLAKKGLPSRAEITDAAMGERAECVMLNKGPPLREALEALDDILQRMQGHQVKKSALLRQLQRW
ncbi:MAG TPA: pyruvate kinase [Candidatus Binataceae bacterium]|nr:pyruvate kinase [Candidatus Binataceae bacterium]